jgi:hypothetical protein
MRRFVVVLLERRVHKLCCGSEVLQHAAATPRAQSCLGLRVLGVERRSVLGEGEFGLHIEGVVAVRKVSIGAHYNQCRFKR